MPMRSVSHKKGFTLIELLIVIAIIAILAAVVFVALNPLQRFRDARDSRRWSDVDAIISAIKLDQVDNGGEYDAAVSGMTAGSVYQLGTSGSNCDTQDGAGGALTCTTALTAATSCIDLTTALVTGGYLGAMPIAPTDAGTSNSFTAARTGYTIQRNANGTVAVRSCRNEGSTEISITR